MKRINAIIILALLAILVPLNLRAAQTAMQVLTRTSELLRRSEGITIGFNMSAGGNSVKGTLKAAGRSFSIVSPAMGAWFDGKCMWTLNPRTKETTLTIPTPEEIAETNPLVMISSNASNFTASYAKTQPKSGKKIVLVPKKRSFGVKSLTVTFSAGSQYPSEISVTGNNGSTTKVQITSVNTKSALKAADFSYPKEKYPSVPVIDLR